MELPGTRVRAPAITIRACNVGSNLGAGPAWAVLAPRGRPRQGDLPKVGVRRLQVLCARKDGSQNIIALARTAIISIGLLNPEVFYQLLFPTAVL